MHCHAGVSRSVAVVLAHVMRARGLDPESALELVRRAHPAAAPNAGFLAQLELWHAMGAKLNVADDAFKAYAVAKLAREREHNGYVAATSVRPDPGAAQTRSNAVNPSTPFSGVAAASHPAGPPLGGGADAGRMLSCRACRRLPARGADEVPHEPGEGVDADTWRRKVARRKWARSGGEGSGGPGDEGGVRGAPAPGGASRGGSKPCGCVFLHPLAWMRGVEEGPVEGKLLCPKCDAKVGHFNWSGLRCGCGAFVCPAFYLVASKVDAMPYPEEG